MDNRLHTIRKAVVMAVSLTAASFTAGLSAFRAGCGSSDFTPAADSATPKKDDTMWRFRSGTWPYVYTLTSFGPDNLVLTSTKLPSRHLLLLLAPQDANLFSLDRAPTKLTGWKLPHGQKVELFRDSLDRQVLVSNKPLALDDRLKLKLTQFFKLDKGCWQSIEWRENELRS